jgi:hypothetical protein
MKKRHIDAVDARTYPMNTESRCLLNGKVYCGDCGSRLIIATTARYEYIDGEKLRKLRYSCYGKTLTNKTSCLQTGYATGRLDRVVDSVIRHIFERMADIPKSEVINSGVAVLQKELESRYKTAQRDYEKAACDLSELKGEVLKAIRGESKFSPELLGELIGEAEQGLADIEAIRDRIRQELNECKNRKEEMEAGYD